MIGNLLKPELTSLIHERSFGKLREILCEFPPVDVAEIFIDLEPADQAVLLRVLPKELAADVFENLNFDQQETMLVSLGNESVAQILNEMDPDDRTAILEELPSPITRRLINLLSPEERAIANRLLGYPEDTIGRLMTPEYIAIKENWTIGRVLEHLQKYGEDIESLNQLFVLGQGGKLVGMVRLRRVVTTPLDQPVEPLVEHHVVQLDVTMHQEEAIDVFKKYDRTILPVVDGKGALVGVVTVDDILDIAEEEVTEDIQKMAGMEALEAPYLDISLFSLVKKRVGWLMVLFVGQLCTIFVMGAFHDSLEQMKLLVWFLPLLISCGGNSGSQASTLIIRAMSLKDVNLTDWARVLVRELSAGFSFGLVLASMAVLLVMLYPFPDESRVELIKVAATVSFSLVGIVLFGCVVGAMLPFGLRLLRFDPAVCSAPLVATLVDVSGLIIYFSIARLIILSP